jgi:CheY-like chemotaxis protein
MGGKPGGGRGDHLTRVAITKMDSIGIHPYIVAAPGAVRYNRSQEPLMPASRLVLIIESDPSALAQMRRVLAGMETSVVAANDEETLRDVEAYLTSKGTPPVLIIARVTLPSGSGIRLLREASTTFPDASHLVVSHYPRNLLQSVPGFTDYGGDFLQEEFTDDQFRREVERVLAKTLGAS